MVRGRCSIGGGPWGPSLCPIELPQSSGVPLRHRYSYVTPFDLCNHVEHNSPRTIRKPFATPSDHSTYRPARRFRLSHCMTFALRVFCSLRMLSCSGTPHPGMSQVVLKKTEEAIADSDIVLFMVDAREGITEADRHYAR